MKTLFFFLLVVVVLVGCSSDNSLEPNMANRAHDMTEINSTVPVPFYGVYDTETTFPPDPSQSIVNVGEGYATHLGKSTITAIHSWAMPDFEGTLEFETKTGAKLFADISGLGQMPDENGIIRFDGDADITGGTKRFINATGHLKIEGWIDLTTEGNQGQVKYEGEIQYGLDVAAIL